MEEKAGPSNSVERKCLICGSKTTSCHLGVDACRACTVFYRRAKKHKLYACRSNTRRCAIDAVEGVIACKRCRFDRFENILTESGAKDFPDTSQPEETEPSPVVAAAPSPLVTPTNSMSPSLERLLQTPSVSSAFSPVSPSVKRERTLLERCKLYYRLMSSMRRTCELSGRKDAPHPMEMSEEDCPLYPATYTALNASTKIALASILEFAGNMFPEFATFSKEERWNLGVAFFYRYHAFDSCYRAHKRFPNDMDKTFGSYTCYFDHDNADGFFDEFASVDSKSVEEAKKFMHDILDRVGRPGRQAILNANPDNDEFHAVLVILFWFTDGSQLRDEIVQIGERYRSSVLQELHAYYREELGLNDYASRVGELFMLILHFERNKDIKEHFEIIRLLGLFTDDTFVYQLQKD